MSSNLKRFGGRTVNAAFWWSLGLSIGAALTVNIAIAALGWMSPRPGDVSVLPGVLVGAIWTVLLAGLAAGRWLLRGRGPTEDLLSDAILVVALLILGYPFYTDGLQDSATGLLANLAIAGGCAVIALRARRTSRLAAGLCALPIPWLGLASFLIVAA